MARQGYESLQVPVDAHGGALKALQIKFVNLLSSLNEGKDRAALAVSARKARIDDITAEAIMHIKDSDSFRATKSTVQSKVLNAMVREYVARVDYQATLDDESPASEHSIKEGEIETSVSIEEHMLNLDQFRYARARSRCDELDQLLWVCRSGLSFDKTEMDHNTGVQ